MTRRRRAAALLGLALLLGVLAASDVAGREGALRRRLGPSVAVVVREPVAAGARFTPRVLGTRQVPARYAPPGALRDPGQVIARRAAVPVERGTDLDPSLLQVPGARAGVPGPRLRRGERALDVVAVAQAESVVEGARVDVLVTYDGADGPGATRVVLEGAEVLDSGPADGADDRAGATAGLPRVRATLRVSLRQAVALSGALSAAREVRLLPRPPS